MNTPTVPAIWPCLICGDASQASIAAMDGTGNYAVIPHCKRGACVTEIANRLGLDALMLQGLVGNSDVVEMAEVRHEA
jgi:hypothetical protein